MGEVAVADPSQVVGVISDFRTVHNIPHRVSCRVLGVSESWFYKHRIRKPTARQTRHLRLVEAVKEEFTSSGGTYGSPKIWVALVRKGWRISVNTIARIMAELGLAGRKVRKRRGLTRPGKRPASPDFVRRDFTAEAPDLVWCGDMTEIDSGEGKLYLATVIDLFSRRLLGYAMGARHDADLVVAALHMAAATRGGDVCGVIFHSDRGSEYGSRKFRRACRKLGVTQSMGRVGSCFDNAVSEAFNSVLKVEYVHRHTFATRSEARIRIATWITDFYNARRLHSVCDWISPIDYEHDYWAGFTEELAAQDGLHKTRGLTVRRLQLSPLCASHRCPAGREGEQPGARNTVCPDGVGLPPYCRRHARASVSRPHRPPWLPGSSSCRAGPARGPASPPAVPRTRAPSGPGRRPR
ncbi:IS3 family transposase [Streptomyces sp. NPDC051020]|uniref:IS3 family transposase n=1 Tax=Streptomyces sp. NPDC051020 TaxID=3155409 RepID=UPI003419C6D1